MIFSIIKIAKNIIRTPIFLRDGLCFFDGTHSLKKYSIGLQLLWTSKPLNYGFALLENSNFFFVYQFEKLYMVTKETGVIVKEKDFPFFPLFSNDIFMYGEAVMDQQKYIAKYEFESDKFDYKLRTPSGHYCNSIFGGYVLLVNEITYKSFSVLSMNSREILWRHETEEVNLSLMAFCFNEILIIRKDSGTHLAFNSQTGELVWSIPFSISAFDEKNGLIFILSTDYLVINALTGEEVIRVENWAENQIEKYPALANIQTLPYLSEEYLVFSSRTREDKIEGGVFFIDKNTAEVKDYFRIVFDKDPVQRKDWDGNKIPDDQQIPFMPLEMPIYKDGRLYVVLPSPIEGQKDLYIYERDD